MNRCVELHGWLEYRIHLYHSSGRLIEHRETDADSEHEQGEKMQTAKRMARVSQQLNWSTSRTDRKALCLQNYEWHW